MSPANNITIEEFKSRLDIVDVVSRVVPLKRAGANHKGVCPFHNEKTPSFVVSEQKQIFTCFGCGATGDVIEFTKRYYNIDFKEATDRLADEYGIERISVSAGNSELEKYYEVNKEAARFFYKAFTENRNPGYSYMKSRGIDDKYLKLFGIGYADGQWDSLYRYFKEKGTDERILIELGLIRKKDDHYYDYFRNRVIFPIINTSGKVIGFGGRKIDEKDEPKYLNSPENRIFSKKNNLYALNTTKQDIAKEGFGIMVEGYMDVIGLYQAGVHNVGASLGTALTENQAKLIKKYTGNVVLSYDADAAGRKAALRGIDVLTKENLKVKVLHVTDGKDPDEFVKTKGKNEFLKLIDGAMNAVDYRVDTIKANTDFNKEQGKIDFMKQVAAMLKELSPVEADIYIKKIADEYHISEGALRMEIQGIVPVKQPVIRRHEESNPQSTELSSMEATIIKLLFMNPVFVERLLSYSDIVKSPVGQRIVNMCFELYGTKGSFTDSDIIDRLDPAEVEHLMNALDKVIIAGNEETVFSQCIKSYEDANLENRQKQLMDSLSIAEGEKNEEAIKRLTLELMEVQKKLHEYGGKA